MSKRDLAILLYGTDFFDDDRVLLMNYEQQGVYVRLLWIALRNGGLPADLDAIATMLKIPLRRFRTKVWPRVAPCWTATGDGRLVQLRQERERKRRAEGAAGEVDEKRAARSERMRRVANERWKKPRNASDDACGDAPRNAHAHAPRNAQRNASTHPPSLEPTPLKPNQGRTLTTEPTTGLVDSGARTGVPEPPVPSDAHARFAASVDAIVDANRRTRA